MITAGWIALASASKAKSQTDRSLRHTPHSTARREARMHGLASGLASPRLVPSQCPPVLCSLHLMDTLPWMVTVVRFS